MNLDSIHEALNDRESGIGTRSGQRIIRIVILRTRALSHQDLHRTKPPPARLPVKTCCHETQSASSVGHVAVHGSASRVAGADGVCLELPGQIKVDLVLQDFLDHDRQLVAVPDLDQRTPSN